MRDVHLLAVRQPVAVRVGVRGIRSEADLVEIVEAIAIGVFRHVVGGIERIPPGSNLGAVGLAAAVRVGVERVGAP